MTRVRAAWEALSPFGQRVALGAAIGVVSVLLIAFEVAQLTDDEPETPAPIVQPVPLSALLDAPGREEVRDVAAIIIGGAQAGWERYVRSSAQPLPLAPEAGSSEAAEASGTGGPGASATAFEHSTRAAEGRDGAPVERTVTPHRELTPTGTTAPSPPSPALTEAEVYAAALAASGSERWAREATLIAWCESRYRPDVVGDAGERGAWQVMPRFHGPVPGDIAGQAAQVHEIWIDSGWSLWSCSIGGAR